MFCNVEPECNLNQPEQSFKSLVAEKGWDNNSDGKAQTDATTIPKPVTKKRKMEISGLPMMAKRPPPPSSRRVRSADTVDSEDDGVTTSGPTASKGPRKTKKAKAAAVDKGKGRAVDNSQQQQPAASGPSTASGPSPGHDYMTTLNKLINDAVLTAEPTPGKSEMVHVARLRKMWELLEDNSSAPGSMSEVTVTLLRELRMMVRESIVLD